MNVELEIDEREAVELLKKGHSLCLLTNDALDAGFVGEVLSAPVHVADMHEVHDIISDDGPEARAAAAKYDGNVIVCPHGRSSKVFAAALNDLGIKAYSLVGGIEGLKQRH